MLRLTLGIWVVIGVPALASAQPFQDATDRCFGTTSEWTNHVELADLDGDGDLDVVFANGGDGATAGTPEPLRAWTNLGSWSTPGVRCTELTASLGVTALSRVVRAIDVDGDGDLDLIAGGAHQTQLRLVLNGQGAWSDGTAQLPQQLTSVGDIEAGDVDGDGDLDLVISDWGVDPPAPGYAGGRTRLYLNDGAGTFSEATVARMPDVLVQWSQDLELVDVDGDWDLDVIVACSYCTGSYLFVNDGAGTFTSVSGQLPAIVTHELAAIDIDGDHDLDLVALDADAQLRERVLINTLGTFTDLTSIWLPDAVNPANTADSAVLALDANDDGLLDLLIGGRGDDRLLLAQSGAGFSSQVATPGDTPSTLALAIGDLDGDRRPDLVNAQGDAGTADKLQLGTSALERDFGAPRVLVEVLLGKQVDGRLRAQVFDRVHDLERVWIEHDGARAAFESPPSFNETDMTWSGGTLWTSPTLHYVSNYRACAEDRAGNEGCSDWVYVYNFPSEHGGGLRPDAGLPIPGDSEGGCCDAGAAPVSSLVLVLAVVPLVRRRRR